MQRENLRHRCGDMKKNIRDIGNMEESDRRSVRMISSTPQNDTGQDTSGAEQEASESVRRQPKTAS